MKRFAKWTAIVVTAGLLFGAIYQRVGERVERGRFPHPGRLVDVGGHNLYLHCVGQGNPTVVLDSALAMTSYTWTPVQTEVARFTRVCSYDRAGYGLSDPGPLPRTSRQLADELYALLQKAGEPGPYVLAGHSLGGYNVRIFASAHPADVAGLLLVDATSERALERLPQELKPIMLPNLTQIKVARAMAEVGIIRAALAFRNRGGQTEAQRAQQLNLRHRSYIRAAAAEMGSLEESGRQVAASGSLGDIPLIVLTRGPVRDGEAPRGLSPTLYQEFERIWRDELQADMVRLSTRGSQRFANHAGHAIPQEEPEAVVNALRDVVSATLPANSEPPASTRTILR
jgi:pimeloyl-ACP methyl ester carboxylesterase